MPAPASALSHAAAEGAAKGGERRAHRSMPLQPLMRARRQGLPLSLFGLLFLTACRFLLYRRQMIRFGQAGFDSSCRVLGSISLCPSQASPTDLLAPTSSLVTAPGGDLHTTVRPRAISSLLVDEQAKRQRRGGRRSGTARLCLPSWPPAGPYRPAVRARAASSRCTSCPTTSVKSSFFSTSTALNRATWE